jgi:hypothetical protein
MQTFTGINILIYVMCLLQRYFVLENGILTYAKSPSDVSACLTYTSTHVLKKKKKKVDENNKLLI